jgi:hypothetical protein
LELSVENCFFPFLNIANNCPNPISIGNVTIPFESCFENSSGQRECSTQTGYEVFGFEGKPLITGTIPEENKNYSIDGYMNNTKFTISFVVTKNLC